MANTNYKKFSNKIEESMPVESPVVESVEEIVEPTESNIYKVDVYALNVRKDPTYESRVIKIIYNGSEIEITKLESNFGYVPEYNGWICMDFVSQK